MNVRPKAILVGLMAVLFGSLAATSDANRGNTSTRRTHVTPAHAPRRGGEDPPEVTLGERLFLETRFAEYFASNSGGDVNATLAVGDPTLDVTVTLGDPLPGPFAGRSMNCAACHLVDQHSAVPGGGNRAYADFASRSPIPERGDGLRITARNSPSLVEASLPRAGGLLLHLDGEFASAADLVAATLTGRNYGWTASERERAIAHVARVVREDDGTGELAAEYGGPYRRVLLGVDPDIPDELRIPEPYRIDVLAATDEQVLDAVGELVAAYIDSLAFQRDEEGNYVGSPYDVFLAKNGLPRRPESGETPHQYARRLQNLVQRLPSARFVTQKDGYLRTHGRPFAFGELELRGLVAFMGRAGNCAACHPPPHFTDFGFHNTGASQEEYDAIHGAGSFLALAIPGPASRLADPDAYLPATAAHPTASGRFRDAASAAAPGRTDLGVWNVLLNPDFPAPQSRLKEAICRGKPCSERELLRGGVAAFKTPGLRDLGHSAPYLHTGRLRAIDEVARFYKTSSELARRGRLRNADPEVRRIRVSESDLAPLAAFLRSLDEDYE